LRHRELVHSSRRPWSPGVAWEPPCRRLAHPRRPEPDDEEGDLSRLPRCRVLQPGPGGGEVGKGHPGVGPAGGWMPVARRGTGAAAPARVWIARYTHLDAWRGDPGLRLCGSEGGSRRTGGPPSSADVGGGRRRRVVGGSRRGRRMTSSGARAWRGSWASAQLSPCGGMLDEGNDQRTTETTKRIVDGRIRNHFSFFK
jgi:hypothetical protein